MADYSIIARTGTALVKYLRERLVPDTVQNENEIGLAAPYDKSGMKVGVYLYDISENSEMTVSGMQEPTVDSARFPSLYLDLFYMITVSSQSDLRFRAEEEARILGRILQVMHDEQMRQGTSFHEEHGLPLRIQLLRLSHEEKTKIWAYNGSPYKLSLFYRIVPIAIDSELERAVSRVRSAEFISDEIGRKDDKQI